jgi:hypothetical protein
MFKNLRKKKRKVLFFKGAFLSTICGRDLNFLLALTHIMYSNEVHKNRLLDLKV